MKKQRLNHKKGWQIEKKQKKSWRGMVWSELKSKENNATTNLMLIHIMLLR